MEQFESYLGQIIDMRLVNQSRFYVNLGKEICAIVSLLLNSIGMLGKKHKSIRGSNIVSKSICSECTTGSRHPDVHKGSATIMRTCFTTQAV